MEPGNTINNYTTNIYTTNIITYTTNIYNTNIYYTNTSTNTNMRPPGVATEAAQTVGVTKATLRGDLTELGTETILAHGFVYGPSTNDLTIGANGVRTENLGPKTNAGPFSQRVAGLTRSTAYYYRAFVAFNQGVIYASQSESFVTATNSLKILGYESGLKFALVNTDGGVLYRVLTLTNEMNAPLTIASIDLPLGYQSSWSNGTIGPLAKQEVTILFDPGSDGSHTGTMTIRHDEGWLGETTRSVSGRSRTITATNDFDLHSSNKNPSGIWSDGETMWVLDSTDNYVYAYPLGSSNRVTNKEFAFVLPPNLSDHGLWSDGETMWLIEDRPNGRRWRRLSLRLQPLRWHETRRPGILFAWDEIT